MSRLIQKKLLPLKDIEARDLKFCMVPYITYTHAVKNVGSIWEYFEKLGQPNVPTVLFGL